MIARQDQQITRAQLFQQLGKPAIEIVEGCRRLRRRRFQHIESGNNQSAGRLLQHPRDFRKQRRPRPHRNRPGKASAAKEIADFPRSDHDLTGLVQHIDHRLARRLDHELTRT